MTDDTPPTQSGTAAGMPQGVRPVTTVSAGTLIMGTYQIEKLINSGGMGEVYRGVNIHNGEPVAIKIVLPALAHDQKIVALFQKESTVLSRLAHEAIVRYHVFTNDPTIGRPCMVMEFVSGLPLADRIAQGPMPLDDVKVMLRRVASGLEKAHRAGVVHRDLSPDNVILEEDQVEHAKLIDFGIAKSTNFGSGTLLGGQFAGKFNWVAPEQLGAFGGHVDGRSDIYSLALITAAASRGAVLQMGASIVDAVGKRSTVPALDGVDPALVPLLTWMLQPDPALRTESMGKVIAALDNPALIPQATPPAPDPNRTVIEPLPIQPAAPSAPPATSALPSTLPPPGAMPGAMPARTAPPPVPEATVPPPPQSNLWDMQARATTPPDGATVIAPHPILTAPPPPQMAEEPDDASPFGAPSAPTPPRAEVVAPVVAKSGGKGGLITVLVLLAVLGGGAGAWFGGVFEPKPVPDPVAVTDPPEAPPVADPPVEPTPPSDQAQAPVDDPATQPDPAQPDPDQAAAEAAAKAAAEAAALADAQAQADAEAQAAAAALAEAIDTARSRAQAVTAARGIAENAREQAETALADLPGAADAAAARALADQAQASADRAAAARDAAATAEAETAGQAGALSSSTELSQEQAALAKTAAADLAAATEAATRAAAAAQTAAATAAKRVEEDAAKAAALASDPVARQEAWLASYALPACVHLAIQDRKAEGFVAQGYGVDTQALEKLSADWTAATGTTPDIGVNLVNEEQCAVLDFLTAQAALPRLEVTFESTSRLLKSGEPVTGTISGIGERSYTLFFVTGAGGATNINRFTEAGTDGSIRFQFAPRLREGAPRTPQLLLLVIGDAALAQALEGVKPNVKIDQLVDYVAERLGQSEQAPALGVGLFQLEN